MADSKKRPPCVLGFYKTVTHVTGDICGGVLITSHLGRPIEFQCSLPVRPNATQQTLYGSSLLPFLKGELIAEALHDKLEAKPDIVFVDDPEAVSDTIWGTIPILCFAEVKDWLSKSIKGQTASLSPAQQERFDKVEPLLKQHVPDSADLSEPLVRVEQALKEAMGQAA